MGNTLNNASIRFEVFKEEAVNEKEKKHYIFDNTKNDEEIKKLAKRDDDNNKNLISEKINDESDLSAFYNDNEHKKIELNVNFFLFSFISIRNLVKKPRGQKSDIINPYVVETTILTFNDLVEYNFPEYIKDNYCYYGNEIENDKEAFFLIIKVIYMIFFYCLNEEKNNNGDIKKLLPTGIPYFKSGIKLALNDGGEKNYCEIEKINIPNIFYSTTKLLQKKKQEKK